MRRAFGACVRTPRKHILSFLQDEEGRRAIHTYRFGRLRSYRALTQSLRDSPHLRQTVLQRRMEPPRRYAYDLVPKNHAREFLQLLLMGFGASLQRFEMPYNLARNVFGVQEGIEIIQEIHGLNISKRSRLRNKTGFFFFY